VLWADTGEPPLDVHITCTQDFIVSASFICLLAAFDAGDHATAVRWGDVYQELIALNPRAHVASLLAEALADPKANPEQTR
jgi:hypothetical protein